MDKQTFDILALGARYWFIALLGFILLKLVIGVVADYAKAGKAGKSGGYSVGLLEIVEPIDCPICGTRFSLRQENRIGSASKCDIRIRDQSVKAVHCLILQRANRVILTDYSTKVLLNGVRIAQDVPLADGDEIRLGKILLLVRISADLTKNVRRKEVFDAPFLPTPVDRDDPDEFGDAQAYDNQYGEYDDGEDEAYYDDGAYDEYDEFDEYDHEDEDDEDEDEYEEEDEYEDNQDFGRYQNERHRPPYARSAYPGQYGRAAERHPACQPSAYGQREQRHRSYQKGDDQQYEMANDPTVRWYL